MPEFQGYLNIRIRVFRYTPVIFCLASSLQAYQPRFTVDVFAQASAVYTLACLSRQIPCTRMKFQGRESQPAVAEWESAFAAMPPIEGDTYSYPFLPNTPALFPEERREHFILEALFDSHSAGELARQAHLDPALARKLWKALLAMRSTMPRTPSSLLTMRNASQRLLRDTRVSQLTQDIGTLLNPSDANESIILNLIPSPDPTTDDATGTMIGRHVFVEITNFAKAEFGPSIAMHETIHYLYDSVSPETHRERMQMFLARSYPRTSSFYTLFNEALAIASQHLVEFVWARIRILRVIPTAMLTFPAPVTCSARSLNSGSPSAAASMSDSCRPTWMGARRNLHRISTVPVSYWFPGSSSLRPRPRPPWIKC